MDHEEDYSYDLCFVYRTLDDSWTLVNCSEVETFLSYIKERSKKDCSLDLYINFSIKLYNHYFLWKIGSIIDIVLKIDKATLKLISKILVSETTLNIEYEGLHLICFNRGLYGHCFDLCGEASFDDEDHCGKAATGKNVAAEENQIMVINDNEEVNPE
ncbi:hypothetical protein Ahy_B03g065399 [Arachis hypogaea]|uniref:Zinc knuckle CX2CX4HX4C domain-containing protein n=1 Tax=Arachis hypogaea TaxID=3818 RepID=A0A445A1H8_ARAHY|nr:hypothetical protein Ahy_B03g065399 [Arachis hypogaea]